MNIQEATVSIIDESTFMGLNETQQETQGGESRQITFADEIDPPKTSQGLKGKLPTLHTSMHTPMSILVNSTISDEGMAGIVEKG